MRFVAVAELSLLVPELIKRRISPKSSTAWTSKNNTTIYRKKHPELTSRMFLEPDSLKDGLHLKLIWRRKRNSRGVQRYKYRDDNQASKSAAQPIPVTGRGYKEKAWSSRTDTCYQMDTQVKPWLEWLPMIRLAGIICFRRKKYLGQREDVWL